VAVLSVPGGRRCAADQVPSARTAPNVPETQVLSRDKDLSSFLFVNACLKAMKAKLDEKLDEMSLADSEKQNDDTENDIQESLISSSQAPSENYSENMSGKQNDETGISENLESLSKTSTEHHS